MIGQYKRDLTVVPYRSQWPELFEREAALLQRTLGDNVLTVSPGQRQESQTVANWFLIWWVNIGGMSHINRHGHAGVR